MKKNRSSSISRFCCGFAILALLAAAGCYNNNNQSKKKMMAVLTAALASSSSSTSGGSSSGGVGDTIADFRVAKESVLRSIPQSAIDAAKNNLKIYYFHTSHGSRVVTGMSGLLSYKSGDSTKFAFTSGGTPVSGSLYIQEAGYDLSAQETSWDTSVRNYLNSPDGASINVVMGSWCDPAGHDHHSYITRMEALIAAYPTKTFVFMTGHPNGDGESTSETSAYHCYRTVTEHCRANNRYCIDYWSIETHGVDDTYYADANDNGVSGSNSYYAAWRISHLAGIDYFNTGTCSAFGDCDCAHASQPVTCNRIAYAAWWIWARVAGWSGN